MAKSQQARGNGAPSPFRMLGLGLDIAGPVVVLIFVGYKLDQWLDSGPWLLVLGAFLGMAVGFYSLIRRVRFASGRNGRMG